jgi:hypothetical protein
VLMFLCDLPPGGCNLTSGITIGGRSKSPKVFSFRENTTDSDKDGI